MWSRRVVESKYKIDRLLSTIKSVVKSKKKKKKKKKKMRENAAAAG
jgi:hypothetical protein